ncbi:hypothetical protein [Streptomyces albidoflavus]|nr:hypothetical protein [Streptomyces albidoflavus]
MTEDLRRWTDHLEVFSLIMKSVSTDEPQTEQAPVAGRTEGPE